MESGSSPGTDLNADVLPILELLNQALSRSASPGEAAEEFADKLRELTGAGITILMQCHRDSSNKNHRVAAMAVDPTGVSVKADDLESLALIAHELSESSLLKWNDHQSEPTKLLSSMGLVGDSIFIPLRAGSVRVGCLLLLGIPRASAEGSILLHMLQVMSSTIALIFRNDLIHNQMGESRHGPLQERVTEDLKERKQNFQDLVENLLDGVVIADKSGNHIYVNHRFAEITGYTVEELLKMNGHDFDRPEDHDILEQRMKDRMSGKPVAKVYQRIIVRKDGSERSVEMSTTVTDWQGEKCPMAIVHDITDRKLAEKALRESERKYRLLADNTADIIWSVDLNLNFTYVSPSVQTVLGYTSEDRTGTNLSELIDQDSFTRVTNIVKDLFKLSPESNPVLFQIEMLHSDGHYVPVEVQGRMLFNEQGEPVGLLGTSRDVTERRQVEDALRDSAQRLRMYFDQGLLGMALTSVEKDWIEVNDALCEMFGYSREEFSSLTWAEMTYPDDLEPDVIQFNRMLSGEIENYSIDKRFIRKNSSIFYSSISVNAVRKAEGALDYVVTFVSDITERKLAEKAHLDSEMRLKGMFNHMSSGVAVFESINNGEDFKFLQLNPAGQRINKASEEQVVGKRITDIFPGVVKNGLLDVFRQVWQTGEPLHNQSVLYSDNRITGWREHFVYLLDTGELVAIFDDVTARRTAELALEEREHYYRMLLHSLHDEIVVIDENYRIVDVNNSFIDNSGHSRKEVIGEFCYKVTHASNVPCDELTGGHECMLKDVFKTGKAFNCRHTHVGADGSPVFLDILLSPMKDANGNVIHVVEAMRDISDMIEVQEERKRLAAAIEQSAETMVITDLEGNIQYTNPAFEKITGYTREEAIGKNPRILQSGEHDVSFYIEMWDSLISGKTWSGRFINRKKDGSLYTEEATITPVLDNSGKAVNYVAVKRDITENLRLEQQYRQAQKEESIGRLAGGVAHDLNNLLTPILGYSELLLRDFSSRDSRRDSIDEIMHAGLRARDLVRQLLAFSRKQTLDYKPLNLNSTISGLEKLLRRTIREDIEIRIVLSPEISTVMADIGQIEQVLMNLTVNAADAMPGGGCLTVETANVYLEDEFVVQYQEMIAGPYVLLSVRDTGSGIDEEIQKHMFEPFYSTKGEQGTGIGLATVYGIVKQHGGSILVQSEPGKGTTFQIYLPVSGEVSSSDGVKEVLLSSLSGTETILLVEDDKRVRELTLTLLKQQGYLVFPAESGSEALSIVESFGDRIDLLLTDVVMPGMNGRELYAAINQIVPRMKVLFMSGYTNDVIARHGVLEEGLPFIHKPFSIMTLASKVRELLERK